MKTKKKSTKQGGDVVSEPNLFICVNIHHKICNYAWNTLDGTRAGSYGKLNPKMTVGGLRHLGWRCLKVDMLLTFKKPIQFDPKPFDAIINNKKKFNKRGKR